jgi:ABC-type polysaccharide/polyol phosphate export permease
MGHELIAYRGLLYEMTRRDLLLRYKQTAMGFAWAIFMPLINTAVFYVIFVRVAKIDVGVPYALFAFSGLTVWNFFASSLKFALPSLTSNLVLVTKVYFPREVFPFSTTLVCLVDFAVAAVALVLLMIYYRVGITPAILYLPFVILVHVIFTLGVALLVAMANLFYRDVKYIFEILLTVWMFATSVLYPLDQLEGKLRLVTQLNPMTPIVEAYRDVLLFGRSPMTPIFLATAAVSVLVLFVSWLTFHRAEYEFAESV